MDYCLQILGFMGIYAILAMALNVICGMTGLLQLGHAGFFAAGAYAAGLLSIYATAPSLGGLNLIGGCLAGMAAAAVFALLIGLPCLRLRGDYLAIATLGFGEIVRMTLNNLVFPGCALTHGESFGGSTGIALPSPVSWGVGYSADYATWWVILIVAALTYVFLLNLKRSSFGRALICIREDEVAAKAMGIHVPRYKMLAFLLSAIFAGLAGALFVHNGESGMKIKPNEFDLLQTVQVLLMVVLGGLGSVTGSVLAAAILVLVPEALKFVPTLYGVSISQHRMLIYAGLLVLLVRLVPNGLLGLHEVPGFLLSRRRQRGRA